VKAEKMVEKSDDSSEWLTVGCWVALLEDGLAGDLAGVWVVSRVGMWVASRVVSMVVERVVVSVAYAVVDWVNESAVAEAEDSAAQGAVW
jgi:hypothetical protein